MRRNQINNLTRRLGYEMVEERKAPTNLFPVDIDVATGDQAEMSYYGDDDTVGGDDDDTYPGSGG